MRTVAHTVIIGGGIQGLSLAHYLTQRGVNDVCLVEMKMLGSGSSGKSASVIGCAFQSETCLALTLWSLGALMRFRDELGADPGYEPIGTLLLGGRRGTPELRRRHALLQTLGLASELVGPEAVDRLTPGLNLEELEVALYLPHEGGLDPHSIMMAYASQARRRGARLLEGIEATGLQIERDRVTGVHTTAGTIECEWVVNAAGFRGRQVAAWAGMDLPITNLKRHIVVTGPVATYSRSIPFTYDWEAAWYMRREGPGLLLGMGATATEEEEPAVEQAMIQAIIDHAIWRAPALEEAGLMTSWAGLRPITPDDDPILGSVPHLGGFINDCGWGGLGVMNAPAAGMALVELIIDGAATTIDLTPFRTDRFEGWKR